MTSSDFPPFDPPVAAGPFGYPDDPEAGAGLPETAAPHVARRFVPARASWSQRAIATWIDGIVTLTIWTVGALVFGEAVGYVLLLASFVAQHWYQGRDGGSPGKHVVGIAVLSDSDLQPIGVFASIVRQIYHFLDLLPFPPVCFGYIRAAWSGRTFADTLAHTVVVSTRRNE